MAGFPMARRKKIKILKCDLGYLPRDVCYLIKLALFYLKITISITELKYYEVEMI